MSFPLLVVVGMPLLQLGALILLGPLLSWWAEKGRAFLSGRSVTPFRLASRRAFGAVKRALQNGLTPGVALALAMVALVFLALPGLAPVQLAGASYVQAVLGDPLFLGLLLLSASAFLGARLTPASLGGAVLVLCVTESLFVLAAPGVNGLEGARVLLRAGPNPGLEGASACCALALGFTGAFPMAASLEVSSDRASFSGQSDERGEASRASVFRHDLDERRAFLAFLQTGWLLLIGDLLLPGLEGESLWGGALAFLARLGAAAAMVSLLQLSGTERNARLAALLAGLGFLLALSGRFAA